MWTTKMVNYRPWSLAIFPPPGGCKWLRGSGRGKRRGCHHHHRLSSTHRTDRESGWQQKQRFHAKRHCLIIDVFFPDLISRLFVNWLDDDEWEKNAQLRAATDRNRFHVSFRLWAPLLFSRQFSLPLCAFLIAIDQRWTTTEQQWSWQSRSETLPNSSCDRDSNLDSGCKRNNNNNRTSGRKKQWIVVVFVTLWLRSRTHALPCWIAMCFQFNY